MGIVNITWDDMEKLVDNLAAQIETRNIKFAGILSIGRGGMIPSRLLSDVLKIKEVYIIPYTTYIGYKRGVSDQRLTFSYKLPHENYLLVDEILETGKTLVEVINYLASIMPDKRFLTA